MRSLSRRQFASYWASASALAALQPRLTIGQTPPAAKTRLILLGTAGGPRPRIGRAAPSQVILVNKAAYVVDCGNGVALQLVRAGVPLGSLRDLFITHHHSDHNADYGNLLLLAWTAGLQKRVDTWGPPPLDQMTKLFFEMNAYDMKTRVADEGRMPLAPLVRAHELTEGGLVLQDENVKVTCALVEHLPVVPALAYRFDTADRSIVVSGDTKPSAALIRLAKGADVLVHEVVYPSAVERLVAPLANAAALTKSILSHHTPVEEVGRVAEAAGVKTLVLSHFVPAEDPSLTEEMWVDLARRNFKGRVIAGKDLLEI
ncbi:MAG: MBL fold metallo-hydrolase [Bryobacteraceae bacterium]